VSLDEYAPITAHVPLRQIFGELYSTFDWALDTSLQDLTGQGLDMAKEVADTFRSQVCDRNDPALSVSEFYKSLLPSSTRPVRTRTFRSRPLPRPNCSGSTSETCGLPRFEILDAFVNQATRKEASQAYDEALRGGTGQYELSRFGTGAIPFDLVIPGEGAGTIRLGTRGAVFMTREPQFISFKTPLTGVADLAKAIEAKFGPYCTLVGKAVSLIGMLAREFVFVFHEGASEYVRQKPPVPPVPRRNGSDGGSR